MRIASRVHIPMRLSYTFVFHLCIIYVKNLTLHDVMSESSSAGRCLIMKIKYVVSDFQHYSFFLESGRIESYSLIETSHNASTIVYLSCSSIYFDIELLQMLTLIPQPHLKILS